MNLNENYTALLYFEKSIEFNKDYEFSSLGKYIALHGLGKDEEVIKEMFSFLSRHDADLYRTTLEELLEGLENGFAMQWEKEIRELAENNGVEIQPGPSPL